MNSQRHRDRLSESVEARDTNREGTGALSSRKSNRNAGKSNVGTDGLRKQGSSNTRPTGVRENHDRHDHDGFTSAASSSIATATATSRSRDKEPSLVQSRSSIFASLKHSSPSVDGFRLTNHGVKPTNIPAYNIPTIIAKLEHLSGVIAAAARWAVEDGPGGGLNEFRATEFEKRLETLFRMCEEVIGEAELAQATALEPGDVGGQ